MKIAPETAFKFALNDRIKRIVSKDPHNMGFFERVMAGGVAGGIAQSAIYPLEMIRTRLGVAPVGTYQGITDCAKQVYRKEGAKAFYRGLTPSMAGIIPYAGKACLKCDGSLIWTAVLTHTHARFALLLPCRN